MRKRIAIAGGVIAVLAASTLGTLAMACRHNVCQCHDGTRVQGFSSALTGPEAYCAEACEERGGGKWLGRWPEP